MPTSDCSHGCGQQVGEGARYCPKCGGKYPDVDPLDAAKDELLVAVLKPIGDAIGEGIANLAFATGRGVGRLFGIKRSPGEKASRPTVDAQDPGLQNEASRQWPEGMKNPPESDRA